MPPDDAITAIRASRACRNLGASGLLLVTLVTTGLLSDPRERAAMLVRPGATFLIAFLFLILVVFATASLALLALYRRRALILSPDAMTIRGIFRTKTIPWESIQEARWPVAGRGAGVLLRTYRGKVAIDLSPVSYSRPDLIVAALRARIDPERHRDWERFAALALIDDLGRPLEAPEEEPPPIDEPEAAHNQALWDRLFPWVVASAASLQVLLIDALPPSSRLLGFAFLPILVVAFWPAPGSFAPSETLRWLGEIPDQDRREAIGCFAAVVKAALLRAMLAILALGLFLAMMTGTLHALRRLAPAAIDENTVVTIASIGFVTVVLGSLLLLDRRKNRAFERQAIEHRRSWIERDTTTPS